MPRTDAATDAALLARVVAGLGGEAFGPALLAWMAPALQAAHVTAFRFDAGLQARVVLTASLGGSTIATQSARVYAGSGLYRHDKLLAAMQRHGAGAEAPAVVRLRRQDIVDAAYGSALWDRFGLVDRVSALAQADGRWTAVNAYRDRAGGAFGTAELRRFAALAPLLLALVQRHLAALRPQAVADGAATRLTPEAASALLQRLPVRLSAREAEVCAYTLAGHTREGIGLALGIAPSSVATLRERAYRKLQIHGAGELFALCLQQAGTSADGSAGTPA